MLAAFTVSFSTSSDSRADQHPPAPPSPDRYMLSPAESATIAESVFGCVVLESEVSATSVTFTVTGFVDGRKCPLESVRDVRCGDFAFMPSQIVVYRSARISAMAGHLARNLVVSVDLQSETAGVAYGTLHGALVFPGTSVADKPAFAWYLSRFGTTRGMDFNDVDGDGAADLIYTYSQILPGGITVVPQDVWIFKGLTAEKLISSGEKFSGVSTSTFEGVPLNEDFDGDIRRGVFRFVSLAPGMPLAGIIERARLAGLDSGWEFHLVADLGDGWRDYLTGTSEVAEDEAEGLGYENGINCIPVDQPPDLPVSIRRKILDLEDVCRLASGSGIGRTLDTAGSLRALWTAFGLRVRGFDVLAMGIEANVAAQWAHRSGFSAILFVPLSIVHAVSSRALLTASVATAFPSFEPSLWESVAPFAPLAVVADVLARFEGLAGFIGRWFDGH